MLLLLAGFLAVGLVFLTSLMSNTIAQCTETNQTTYNDTPVNGAGIQQFNLNNYLSGPAALNLKNTSSNGTVSIGSCWTSAITQNLTLPQTCLSITNLTLTYANVNITNASLVYNGLGTCAYPTNSYKALNTTTNLGLFFIQVIGMCLLGLFALWIFYLIVGAMGGGQ
jgi:hypothetical protein